MVDDLFLILASVGAATGAGALLRRRTRTARPSSTASFVGAGARQLADALGPGATEPLPFAGPAWRSLAETLEPCACERRRRTAVAPPRRETPTPPAHHA